MLFSSVVNLSRISILAPGYHQFYSQPLTLNRFFHPFHPGQLRPIPIPRASSRPSRWLERSDVLPAGDVTIFDPELVWTYDLNRSFSKSRNTPLGGETFRGGPVATVVAGAVVWRRE